MIIDTKEEASTLGKTKTFVLIIYVVSVMLIVVFIKMQATSKMMICGALSVLFLLFYWFQYNMEYTYFYFSNNKMNLIFKFYSLRIFFGKPKTIEIPKSGLMKYEIVKSFFKQKESLILYQKTPKGIAKYPPISLTLLSKKQKKELELALGLKTK